MVGAFCWFRVQQHIFRIQEPIWSVFRATLVACSGAALLHIQEPFFSCSVSPFLLFRSPFVPCLRPLLFHVQESPFFRVKEHSCFLFMSHSLNLGPETFFVLYFARRKLVQLPCLNTDQYRYVSLCSQFITHNRPVIRPCVTHENENAATKLSRMHVSVMR